MKILHIITSLSQGGAQSMLRDVMAFWPAAEDVHEVICLDTGGPVAAQIMEAGHAVHVLGMRPGRISLQGMGQIMRLVGATQPDIVQTWLYHADLLGGLAARLAGRAATVWGIHHSVPHMYTLKRATRTVVRLNARLSGFIPAAIVCCADSALESHAGWGYARARMLVIHNGVDTQRFRPDAAARAEARAALGLAADTPVIGMFARLHRQKAHATMIWAAGILHKTLPEVRFVLAGEGIDAGNTGLEPLLRKAWVADAFHMLGPREDMPRLHAALDLFTLASREGEAFPLVIAEAMACGVPCVGTDVGDVALMLGDTGVCVPPSEPEALADAWISILSRSATDRAALGQAARRRAVAEFDVRSSARRYAQLYQDLLA